MSSCGGRWRVQGSGAGPLRACLRRSKARAPVFYPTPLTWASPIPPPRAGCAVAGAGVPGHLHWHIVPRWPGDVNFMPAVAAARVLPQSLDALWEQLTKAAAEDPA